MLLEKRESSVRARIEPLGAETLYISIDFGSKQLNFQPSSVVGDQFGEFICALYTLYEEESNEIYDGHSEWHKRKYHTDEDYRILSKTVTIEWDGEGPYMILEMSRAWDGDTVHIRASTDYGKTYTEYEANDRDFCYAIAKAVTEALKEFGFYGFFLSTEGAPLCCTNCSLSKPML